MEWPLDPWLLGTLVATGAWYWLGTRRAYVRSVSGGRRRRHDTALRMTAFYSALAVLLFALASLDRLADELFWVHMFQHVLLILVVAPLLVVAAPWSALWRPFPLRFRRSVAGGIARRPVFKPLRHGARWLALPLCAWFLLNGDIALWHVPSMYDLTLTNVAVHYLEHLTFIVFGVLFWAQTIDSPPLRARLGYFQRAVFAAAGAVAGWILAVVLAFAPHALYGGYADLAHRPGGISALSDQQLAAGVMWGPGSITYAIVVVWALYRWLDDEKSEERRRRTRPEAVRPREATSQRPLAAK